MLSASNAAVTFSGTAYLNGDVTTSGSQVYSGNVVLQSYPGSVAKSNDFTLTTTSGGANGSVSITGSVSTSSINVLQFTGAGAYTYDGSAYTATGSIDARNVIWNGTCLLYTSPSPRD